MSGRATLSTTRMWPTARKASSATSNAWRAIGRAGVWRSSARGKLVEHWDVLQVMPNALSANLKVLSHAGLIGSRRDGRSIIYAADYSAMSNVLGFLMEDCCGGDAAICAPLVDIAARSAC